MDRIPVSFGDVIGVTNDVNVGAVAVSYTAGPARILRRPISRVDGSGRRRGTGLFGDDRATAPEVGKVYEFTVVPFALEFSLNADVGMVRHDVVHTSLLPRDA